MGDEWEWKLTIEPRRKGGPGSGHHGHAGRPGKRGGSAPGKARGGMGNAQAPSQVGEGNNAKVSRAFDNETVGFDWQDASDRDKSMVKGTIVDNLAKTSGATYSEVNDFIRQWARSSNDDDVRSLAIQRDAAAEFGVPLSEFTKSKLEINESPFDPSEMMPGFSVAKRHPLLDSEKQRKILRAMYDDTQFKLRQMGIGPDDPVTVYRGIRYPPNMTRGWKTGQLVDFDGNAIESWSLSQTVAEDFAPPELIGSWDISKARSVVFKSDVPAKLILSLGTSGFGCLTEGEVTVLGGRGTAEIAGLQRMED